jgi:hypothetical protein
MTRLPMSAGASPNLRIDGGASNVPTKSDAASGTVKSPVSNGVCPRAVCKYCDSTNDTPENAMYPSTNAPAQPLGIYLVTAERAHPTAATRALGDHLVSALRSERAAGAPNDSTKRRAAIRSREK